MSAVTINATVNAENDLFTAVEVTDIETGQRVYYSGDLELANDEQLDAFLMGKGFELDTEAAGTWEHGIVLSGTQRGRKVRTERAPRQPRDRRPARPAVKVEQSAAEVVEEIKDAEKAMNGQLIFVDGGQILGVSGLADERSDCLWVITGRYSVQSLVGDYLQHVDAEFTTEDAYLALANDLMSRTAAWRAQMAYDLDSQLV